MSSSWGVRLSRWITERVCCLIQAILRAVLTGEHQSSQGPVDVRVMLVQPRGAENDGVSADVCYTKRDIFLVIGDAKFATEFFSDELHGATIDGYRAARRGTGDEGKMMGMGEFGADEVGGGTGVDEDGG